MEAVGQGKNISTSLRRKDYEPCKYFQTSVTDLKSSRNICDVRENRYTHDREAVEIIFNTFHKKFIDNTCLTKEQENILFFKYSDLTAAKFIDIENATIQQSKCEHGFLKVVFNSLKYWESCKAKQQYILNHIIRNNENNQKLANELMIMKKMLSENMKNNYKCQCQINI